MRPVRAFVIALLVCGSAAVSYAASFKYIRQGNSQDVQTRTAFGVAMMGGDTDLDEAFRWLCIYHFGCLRRGSNPPCR
jgi:hypothetical protein